jgi:multidrug efflux pump subunit AcrA (membrane-fusion protein)
MSLDQHQLPAPPERKLLPPGHREGIARVHPWRIALIAAAAILALFLIGYFPRHNREKAANAAAEKEESSLPVVHAAKVTRSPAVTTLLLPGNITPVVEAYIYARATGYVRHRYADIGDRVRQGQLLADIEAPDLDAQVAQGRAAVAQAEQQLAQARASLENAQAQEELARVTWERYRVLVQHGAVSRQDADQQLANYKTAAANVRLQEASIRTNEENVRASRANLERLIALQGFEQVRAPFAGVITARNFDVGAFINAGGATTGSTSTPNGGTQVTGQLGNSGANGSAPAQTTTSTAPTSTGAPSGSSVELFREAQIQTLRILVNVPQENAPTVRPGQPAAVFVQEFPHPFEGNVTRTSQSLDQTVRTLLTEVEVANRGMVLLPGMYAQVRFADRRPNPPLLVPGDAVMAMPNGLEVAVLEDLAPQERRRLGQQARRIHIQTVQVGRDYGPTIEITSGLQGWEYVVTNPGDAVQEGAVVVPQSGPPVAGENTEQRRGESAEQPTSIGSPSMAAPTQAPEKGGRK